jgi:hypothetical protein
MKVGILTQHLHNNYGGLLQAYALQKCLLDMGHTVLTVDFTSNDIGSNINRKPRLWGLKGILINSYKKYFLRKSIDSIFGITDREKASIGRETRRFLAENIRTTQRLSSIDEFPYLKSYNFDAFIVGSDQVWRPAYSPGLSAFFLDFLGNDQRIKRLAYAASFGTDNCDEYTEEDLARYTALCQKFNGITVREDSAVELCKKYFSVNAKQVVDPTMLLEQEDYIQLVNRDNISPSHGDMMVYVLDKTQEKQRMIKNVAKVMSLKPFTVMPDDVTGIYPPVTQWIRGFMDAKYVVTDSFHGVAFSIIFNKQFIAIGNNERGLARFTSVLKIFGLENRLVLNEIQLTEDKINSIIDFDKVNIIRKEQKKYAYDFLFYHLNNSSYLD